MESHQKFCTTSDFADFASWYSERHPPAVKRHPHNLVVERCGHESDFTDPAAQRPARICHLKYRHDDLEWGQVWKREWSLVRFRISAGRCNSYLGLLGAPVLT